MKFEPQVEDVRSHVRHQIGLAMSAYDQLQHRLQMSTGVSTLLLTVAAAIAATNANLGERLAETGSTLAALVAALGVFLSLLVTFIAAWPIRLEFADPKEALHCDDPSGPSLWSGADRVEAAQLAELRRRLATLRILVSLTLASGFVAVVALGQTLSLLVRG